MKCGCIKIFDHQQKTNGILEGLLKPNKKEFNNYPQITQFIKEKILKITYWPQVNVIHFSAILPVILILLTFIVNLSVYNLTVKSVNSLTSKSLIT